MHRFPLSPVALFLAVWLAHVAAQAQDYPVFDIRDHPPEDGVLLRVHGSVGMGQRGVPVAGAMDVDGDNLADYAVAYLTASPLGRAGAGEVDLVFGTGVIGGIVDTATDQARVLRIAGDTPSEAAGCEIWIDDVTGDGLGDLLLCRQNHDPGGRPGAGALTILVGGPELRAYAETLQFLDLRDPPDTLTLFTIVGHQRVGRFGLWVRPGDVDGDGVPDLVIGADQVDRFNERNRGEVYVILGGDHLAQDVTVDLADFGNTILQGKIARVMAPAGSADDHFGATCYIADLDGNNRGEVLSAATILRSGAGIRAEGSSGPDERAVSDGGTGDGTLYIVWDDNFPQPPWPAGFSFRIDEATGSTTTIDGAGFNAHYGEEIVGGLDYDKDGNPDLFVGDLAGDGSPDLDRPFSGVGFMYWDAADLKGLDFSMNNPPPALRITQIASPVRGAIGADTAAHGDYDGDGIADLLYANPHDNPAGRSTAGTVFILYGQPGGWPAFIDLERGNLPALLEDMRFVEIRGALGTTSTDGGDTLAYSASHGDADGDGVTDVIINEMLGNGLAPGTLDVGNLLIISGPALGAPALPRLNGWQVR